MRLLLATLFGYLRTGGEIEARLLIVEPDRIRVRS
jgi:hypothetical protein